MNTSPLTRVPSARVEGLVVTESREDLLVYDTDRQHIHHLNQTSAAVWRACDGRRTVDELQAAATAAIGGPVSGEAVRVALGKLADANLLVSPLDAHLRGPVQSRRTLLRRAVAAGAVAAPVLVSISAPRAAAAQSGSCPGFGPPVLEDQCKFAQFGQCCCDDPGAPDEDCGTCGFAPGDDMDDDMKCLGNEDGSSS